MTSACKDIGIKQLKIVAKTHFFLSKIKGYPQRMRLQRRIYTEFIEALTLSQIPAVVNFFLAFFLSFLLSFFLSFFLSLGGWWVTLCINLYLNCLNKGRDRKKSDQLSSGEHRFEKVFHWSIKNCKI